MIVVTGAAGFIGSCLVSKLNALKKTNLILVDDFSCYEKNKNLYNKSFHCKINRDNFLVWFQQNSEKIKEVYHLGARTDTTELNYSVFQKLNLEYSIAIWNICTQNSIPLVYASSAATYGLGEFSFDDKTDLIKKLRPLNAYGRSKNDFDRWVINQKNCPPFWAGFKFFNVFGPNEFHKGRMASVILQAFNQIIQKREVRLFKSHNSEYKDGEQLRDFIYVKDVIDVLLFMMDKKLRNGIYNLGSGVARTFNDLVLATFRVLNLKSKIIYIDTPEDIRENYQYFTQANMNKLFSLGYQKSFVKLENGIQDYVKNYLLKKKFY